MLDFAFFRDCNSPQRRKKIVMDILHFGVLQNCTDKEFITN